jgi:hypothetical protein
MTPASRRLVNVYVHASIIEGLFSPSRPGVWHRTDFGLPEGAICVNKWFEYHTDRMVFTFNHESFPEVPEGERTPEFRGIETHAFCFDSPASDRNITELNRLTRAQIGREERRQKGETPTPYDEIVSQGQTQAAPITFKMIADARKRVARYKNRPQSEPEQPDDSDPQPHIVKGSE